MSVMIVTSLRDIVVDLFADRCSLTCKNFLKLRKIKYYNGCLFHTVQKDFTAQTGDPTGTGSGGDFVYKFLIGDQDRFFGDEIDLDVNHSKTGTIAMASAGKEHNASQFYITLRDDLDYLDGKHTVDDDVQLEDDWVPMHESLGPQQLEEVLCAKEAHSSAVVLESIGDIPEAEMKPPDNVLFVFKLNPVTEDGDLHIIFMFWNCNIKLFLTENFGCSADIIRDYKTGDSLCYAFIEFEDKEACEQAYFKMDNALIDDRRRHVDFSHSVAKLWSQYGRRDQMNKGNPTSTQQHSKYILKDGNAQHGGDDNSRYEMVFNGDDTESPKGNKRQRYHEPEKDSKRQHMKRADLDNQEEDRRKDSHNLHRQHERSKHLQGDEKYRGDRRNIFKKTRSIEETEEAHIVEGTETKV